MGTGTEEYYRRWATDYDVVYTRPERQSDLLVVRFFWSHVPLAKIDAFLEGLDNIWLCRCTRPGLPGPG